MTSSNGRTGRGWLWPVGAVVVLVAALLFTSPGQALGGRFLKSLRMPAPDHVSVTIPSFGGGSRGHDVMGLVGGMLAATPTDTAVEPDRTVADLAAAGRLAGFTPVALGARHDKPAVTVTGSRRFSVAVDRDRLRTIYHEAAAPTGDVPPAVNGARVAMSVPRGIRLAYGHCPLPANTLQAQIQGPPPLPSGVADCVILTEQPRATAQLPIGLAVRPLVGIALQLSGMSPNEATAFRNVFEPHAVLSMILPRFTRSSDSATVGGTRAVLLNTGGRRAPDWVLVWVAHDMVLSLSGYGSPTDAVPLARSVQ